MRGRFITGLAAGALIGAAASMLTMPQMDYSTRRRVNKTSRRFVNRAENLINDLRDYAK